MGRQIRFFMGPKDEEIFFCELKNNSELILMKDYFSNRTKCIIDNLEEADKYTILISTNRSQVELGGLNNDKQFISLIESDVIEFSRSTSRKEIGIREIKV